MVDIQSATTENRGGKNKEEKNKEERPHLQNENLMMPSHVEE